MADEKQEETDVSEQDEKLLKDLEVDEETDVRGGRRASPTRT